MSTSDRYSRIQVALHCGIVFLVAARYLLLALHVAGAVVQKVWLKTDGMTRMSPARIFADGAAQERET
ncbi:hypothetical protein [Dinoroseobacter shibae]|jgi:cytochrome b561|uniref:hypothetical protein n=1 Tax=Dinoroseobacter shibae TaxID=215813 RepID=UPI0005C55CF9|nr:hypothetical protein [Dinoroseobacter shibae]URF45696.1 hypothetical protein M8008_13030 [Dinoroseobacter shibae]URF50001.1 hypothetical protein M8007_13030 [Dinoroseobacter shibae]